MSLRELAKTCNFCDNNCLQKALRDQIIEGLQDGDTIQEQLLQVKDLDQAIMKCRGLEASRTEILGSTELNAVQTKPQRETSSTCIGCGYQPHDGGQKNCPAYKQSRCNCGKICHFSRVCRQKPTLPRQKQRASTMPQTRTLSTQLPHSELIALRPAIRHICWIHNVNPCTDHHYESNHV